MSKKFKLIACEILFREFSYCAALCENIIDVSFLPKGLHDIGEEKMYEMLQKEIDSVDVSIYEAILLGYGLCNNGIRGLNADLPIVVPRAHDCITLLLGSKEKYSDYFDNNPGTYFMSPGWLERDTNLAENEESVTSQLGMNKSYEEYVKEYGEENAAYIMETLHGLKNYRKVAYIDTGVGNPEKNKKQTKECAEENGWEYEELDGSKNLLQRLLDGEWNSEEFLVVMPNNKIIPTNTEEIIGIDSN